MKLIAVVFALVLLLNGCSSDECSKDEQCTYLNQECSSIDDLEGFHKLDDLGFNCECTKNKCQFRQNWGVNLCEDKPNKDNCYFQIANKTRDNSYCNSIIEENKNKNAIIQFSIVITLIIGKELIKN